MGIASPGNGTPDSRRKVNNMAISRGSVRHSLTQDIAAFCGSLLMPARFLRSASADECELLRTEIRKRFGIEHVSLFPYARSGFHSILRALDLPPGAEVLMTPISIGPMLEVVLKLGCKPVFVDLELNTFGPDPAQLESLLEKRPGAFLLTCLFGYVPDHGLISELCRKYGVPLIEDFSHNIGAAWKGQPLGTFGTASVYSASLLKYVDSFNGAFVMANDRQLAQKIQADVAAFVPPNPGRVRKCVLRTLIWNTALNRWVFNIATFPMLKALRRFQRNLFEKILGPSITLNPDNAEIQDYYFEQIAAVQARTMLRQFSKLDLLLESRRQQARHAITALQHAAPDHLPLHQGPGNTDATQTYWQFVIPVNSVPAARQTLFDAGVETGSTNLLDLAAAYGIRLPGATAVKESHIFIPLHKHLTEADYLAIFQRLRDSGQLRTVSPAGRDA
jgi:dTDP-4-amino-4,6-dideoxygalactose transaminase